MKPLPADGDKTAVSRGVAWRASLLRMVLLWLDQRPIHFALIALVSVALAFWLRTSLRPDMEYFDNLPLDNYYFRNRHAVKPSDVANKLPHTKDIVLIDTSYLMPRALQEKLLRNLRLAKVVAYDFMFVDREAELSEEERPLYNKQILEWRRDTEPFAKAVRESGNVILGVWPEQEIAAEETVVANEAQQVAGARKFQEIWQRPPAPLWDAARDHAHLAVEPGITRHVHLFLDTPERTPSLGLAIAGAYLGMTPEEIRNLRVENGYLQLKNHRVPVGDEWMRINYIGARESFESLENHAVYTAALDYEPEDFAGKIVIIGESSLKSKEILDTPSGPMPGMQIHANIAATLLSTRGAPSTLPMWQTLLFSLGACLLLIAPLLRLPLWASFLAALVLVVATYFGIQGIYATAHRVLPFSLPLFAIGLTYNAVALYEYRRARETLGRFIGQEMVAPTLSLFSRLQLGGRVEEASAFFCDLRGYTTLSEKLLPGTTARLLSEYTSTLVRVVRKHGGRPIDYQGDGVFVLFEPALGGAEFARRAVSAAIELQGELRQLQQKWKAEGLDVENTTVGIGIDTGPMMIGLVGAQEHLKPGAVGDAVNVAARVQQLSVVCGRPILLTRATLEAAGEEFCREIGAEFWRAQPVRGRETPIELFGAGEPLPERSEGKLD